MMNEYLITIDVDWASDPIIKEAAKILIDNNIKSTWFITHKSPAIMELMDYPDLFELGVHPNFEANSTQGKTPIEVLKYLKEIFPSAKSVRTHSLLQSIPLLKLMSEKFELCHDVSIFLPGMPNIIPHEIFFSESLKITRIPYFWGDNQETYKTSPNFSISDSKYHVEGIKIFSFHPIQILLNANSIDVYNNFKSKIDVTSCQISDLEEFINASGSGSGTFFRELVHFIKTNTDSNGLTISELALEWKSLNDSEKVKNSTIRE